MLEKDIERALVQRVKELGGMAEKFVSPTRRAVPDRIVTLPGPPARNRQTFRRATMSVAGRWGVMCA